MDTKKLLGRRLKELIKQKNISQEKLAEMVNIEPAALSNIVTGRNYPLFSTLEKIIKVLGISFNDVFNFEHKNSSEDLKKQIDEMINQNPERLSDFYKIIKALTK